MVVIRGNQIKTSSNGACSGVFLGQNNNTSWDSISTTKMTNGLSMGDYTAMYAYASAYVSGSCISHTTNDNDIKDNGCWFVMD